MAVETVRITHRASYHTTTHTTERTIVLEGIKSVDDIVSISITNGNLIDFSVAENELTFKVVLNYVERREDTLRTITLERTDYSNPDYAICYWKDGTVSTTSGSCPSYKRVSNHDGYSRFDSTVTIEYETDLIIDALNIKTGNGIIELPIMDNESPLRVQTTQGTGYFNLVDLNDEKASPLRIMTSDGIKSIARR